MKHRPRKRFGQHFLVDPVVVERIVDALGPRPGEALVEIGPGLGALTLPVLHRAEQLTVIELDRELAARLRGRSGLALIEADALKVDFDALAAQLGAPLRLFGNLPYNISTPLLFHLLPSAGRIFDQHFMLQREVVARMAARPGRSDYGRLSVMLQWRYSIDSLFDVVPECFDPPPAVHSSVVRMLARAQPPHLDTRLLGEIVATAFSQRRKLLRHTLGRWLDARAFGDDFDVQRRAEEVSVDEYVRLAQAVANT